MIVLKPLGSYFLTKVGIKNSSHVAKDCSKNPVDTRVATVASIISDTDTESLETTSAKKFERKFDADGLEVHWVKEGYEENVEKSHFAFLSRPFSRINAITWKVRRITTFPMRKVFNKNRRSLVLSWIKYPIRYFSYSGRLNLIFKKEIEGQQKQKDLFNTKKLNRKFGNNFLVNILSNQLDWLGDFENSFEYQYLQDWHISDEIKDAPIMFHRDVVRVFRKVQNLAMRLHIPFSGLVESKYDYYTLRESIEKFLQTEELKNMDEHPLVIDIQKKERLYHRYFSSNKIDVNEIHKFVDPKGRNILHYLTLADKDELVKAVLNRTPSLVYERCGEAVSPLVFAAQNKNTKILRRFLFSLNALPYHEKGNLIAEAFTMAREVGFRDGIILLGDQRECHQSLLYSVQRNRDQYKYYLEDLLTSKENIEAIRGSSGENLLIVFVLNKDYELIELLLNKCPELIDKKNDSGETALSIASKRGDSKILSMLLAIRVGNDHKNNVLNDALVMALEKCQGSCFLLLMENGADPFVLDYEGLNEPEILNVIFTFQIQRLETLMSENLESKESFGMIVDYMSRSLKLARNLKKHPQELILRRMSLELISKEQERLQSSDLTKLWIDLIHDCQEVLLNIDVNEDVVSQALLLAHERALEVLPNRSHSFAELKNVLTTELSLDILLDRDKLLDEEVLKRIINEMQGIQFEPSLEKKVIKNIVQNYLGRKKGITKNHALRKAIDNREYFEAAYLLRHGAEIAALETQEEKRGLVNAIIAWRVELFKTEIQEILHDSYHHFSSKLLNKGFYHLVLAGFSAHENISEEVRSSFVENMFQQLFLEKTQNREESPSLSHEAISTSFQQALNAKDYFGIWVSLLASAKIPDSLSQEEILIIKQALLYCVFGRVFLEEEITEDLMADLLPFYYNFSCNEVFFFLSQNGANINCLSKYEVLDIAKRKWGLDYSGNVLLPLEIDTELQNVIVVAQSGFSGNHRSNLKNVFATEKEAELVWNVLKEGASGLRLSDATKEVIKSSISRKLGCGPKGAPQLLVDSVFESDNIGAQQFILSEYVNLAIKGDLDKIKDPGMRNYIHLEAELKKAVDTRNASDIWLALHMGAFGKGLTKVDRRVVELAISQVLELDPNEDIDLIINYGMIRNNVGVVKFFIDRSPGLEKVVDLDLTKDPKIKAYIKSFRSFLF